MPDLLGRQHSRRVCSKHDTTWQFPVADSLASATKGKVQEITRAVARVRRQKLRKTDPRLSPRLNAAARGGLCCRSAVSGDPAPPRAVWLKPWRFLVDARPKAGHERNG